MVQQQTTEDMKGKLDATGRLPIGYEEKVKGIIKNIKHTVHQDGRPCYAETILELNTPYGIENIFLVVLLPLKDGDEVDVAYEFVHRYPDRRRIKSISKGSMTVYL